MRPFFVNTSYKNKKMTVNKKMTEQIWKEFNGQLLSFLKTKINDFEIAKDILQDVFIKVHQKIDTIKEKEKIDNWIYKITKNAIIDYYRRKKLRTTSYLNREIFKDIDLENSSFTKCLMPFIKQLSDKEQDVLIKTSFENISQKKYANLNNLSYSTTKSRVQRAKKKLKKKFSDCCKVKADKYGNIVSYTKNLCNSTDL